MRSPLFAGVVLALASVSPALGQQPVHIPPQMVQDVRFLASDALGGRLTGTAGADSAAAYVARRFADEGLQPARDGWFQVFAIARDAPGARQASGTTRRGRNVIGILPGSDPVLSREAVIVGAHYDHLGGGEFGSLDPDSTGIVHNGADDNASGVAALIYTAHLLRAKPPRRTVIFIAFAGEEMGLLGSDYYVKHAPYPLAQTEAMINLDMVGRMRQRRLIVYGAATAREFPALLDSLNWYQGFALTQQGNGYGPSDQSSFYAAQRPVLHLFTDLHEDYHRATDDWEKINFPDLVRVGQFTAGLVSALGSREGPLTFVDVPAPAVTAHGASAPSVTGGYGAYLGTIPDMSGGVTGVRLTGIRTGSPAFLAGLRAGDVIQRIGTLEVNNLQDMTTALRSFRAGESAEIQLQRGTDSLTVRATFGTRN